MARLAAFKNTLLLDADQANGNDHRHQDDREHYGIFGDILALFAQTQLPEEMTHSCTYLLDSTPRSPARKDL